MEPNKEGFLYPSVSIEDCVNCNLCVKTCHINNGTCRGKSDFYMGWNLDKEILLDSASGGAFSALAKLIFDRGGIVFGAFGNLKTREVYHVSVDSYSELGKIRKSKYYQSEIRETYKDASHALLNNIPVLFSGTACQIAGLYHYLKHTKAKERLDNLYTVDVLCHGVASKKVVKSYINSKEKKYKKRINEFSFRVKTPSEGWKNGAGTRMQLVFDDGNTHVDPQVKDTFFCGFNNNLFLRESCYRCRYCGTERVGDFTIADYWGVPADSVSSEMMHDGISLLLFNSEKSREYVNEIKKYMHIEEIKSDIAISHNLALVKPQARPEIRSSFFDMLDKKSYDTIIQKLYWKSFLKADVKAILKSIFGENNYQKTVEKVKYGIKRKKPD